MKIQLEAYAKINLTLDVGKVREDGMHPVDMIMQIISLKDIVSVELVPGEAAASGLMTVLGTKINIEGNSPDIPRDESNLAFKAAKIILEEFKPKDISEVNIYIEKNIPVAAGLAGGSGNGGAVLHGLNALLNLDLSMEELCRLGERLGSDVPFSMLGQAKGNTNLPEKIQKKGAYAARATGTGTLLEPCTPLDAWVLISKPSIGVSTKEVYEGIDEFFIARRPNNQVALKALNDNNMDDLRSNMINVLENYTLEVKSQVAFLKDDMLNLCDGALKVLMSGSGPTIFAIFKDEKDSKAAYEKLRNKLSQEYVVELCHTMI